MGESIGLLAGSGKLPILAAQGILAAGHDLIAVALNGETGPEFAAAVPNAARIPVGRLARIIDYFRDHGVSRLVFAGKVQKTPVFDSNADLDADFQELLSALSKKNDDAILGAVVDKFAGAGLTVLPQAEFLPNLLAPPGILTRRAPTPEQRADIAFGFEMAKAVGGLDFGQSVVVKNQAILAVEAVEGTDETIRRGGRLGRGEAILVKVSKPCQDQRFDVPTVGPSTIGAMLETGVTVMAVEAGKTFFIERAGCLRLADTEGLTVVGLDSTGAY